MIKGFAMKEVVRNLTADYIMGHIFRHRLHQLTITNLHQGN